MADPLAAVSLADRLAHVYWIGGGSGGAKSTVAARIAALHGLRLYATDEAMGDHGRRTPPAEAPQLQAFIALDMDQRWADRSPQTMLETFHWYRGEGFGRIVEDLLELAPERVIAEGFRLLPDRVAPLLRERRQALWLLPTPAFRRTAFEQRGSLWEIAGRTRRPERALANLLERDRLFTDRLAAETAALALPSLTVDGSRSLDALIDTVATRLGLSA